MSSSFIPFIVIFLHAIAAIDMTSVALLEQVMGTLENSRNTSQSSERFFTICATFTEIAKKLVQSQRTSIGIYNQQQDSLRFPDTLHGMSPFYPENAQNASESGAMNHASPSSAIGILNDWLSGPPFPWDKFEVDFENFP